MKYPRHNWKCTTPSARDGTKIDKLVFRYFCSNLFFRAAIIYRKIYQFSSRCIYLIYDIQPAECQLSESFSIFKEKKENLSFLGYSNAAFLQMTKGLYELAHFGTVGYFFSSHVTSAMLNVVMINVRALDLVLFQLRRV